MIWNGRAAAISLTFDDGLPVQIEHAIPAMERAGACGTFFVIQNTPYDSEFRTGVWLDAIKRGHEIGSHSVNHRKAAELTFEEALFEVGESRRFMHKKLGRAPESFCYPYTDAPSHLQLAVSQFYKQARGGRVARADKFIEARDTSINMMNIPAYHVGPGVFANGEIWEWITEAVARQAWLTLMLHGVGPDTTQWDNISTEQFTELLAKLKEQKVWIAPFGQVANEFRKRRGW